MSRTLAALCGLATIGALLSTPRWEVPSPGGTALPAASGKCHQLGYYTVYQGVYQYTLDDYVSGDGNAIIPHYTNEDYRFDNYGYEAIKVCSGTYTDTVIETASATGTVTYQAGSEHFPAPYDSYVYMLMPGTAHQLVSLKTGKYTQKISAASNPVLAVKWAMPPVPGLSSDLTMVEENYCYGPCTLGDQGLGAYPHMCMLGTRVVGGVLKSICPASPRSAALLYGPGREDVNGVDVPLSPSFQRAFEATKHIHFDRLPVYLPVSAFVSKSGHSTSNGLSDSWAFSAKVNAGVYFTQVYTAKPKNANKIGKLLLKDGLRIMTGDPNAPDVSSTVEDTPLDEGDPDEVLLPGMPEGGYVELDVVGTPSTGAHLQRLAADDGHRVPTAGQQEVLDTGSANAAASTPYDLTANPTAQGAALLGGDHGPVPVTATLTFTPKGGAAISESVSYIIPVSAAKK